MCPAGLEPATSRVWSGRDHHYTTETVTERELTFTNLLAKSVQTTFFFYLAWFVNLKSNSFRKRSQNKLSAKEHMKTWWPIFKVMWIKRRGISNAPMGFELMTTCSQDRRPNQLSQGALHSIIITCFIFVIIFLLERLQRVKLTIANATNLAAYPFCYQY